MKSKYLLLITYLLSAVVVLSPILYLLARCEYDRDQVFVPQRFAWSSITTTDSSNREVVQEVLATDDRLVGFDLSTGYGDIPGDDAAIEVLNEEGESVRIAKLEQSILVSNGDVLNFRFEEIKNSKGKHYNIVFPALTGFSPRLHRSKEDFYYGGDLVIGGKVVQGNINIVPVYKSDSPWEIVTVLWNRVTSTVFSE